MTPRERVLAAYCREMGSVLSWDARNQPSRVLAFSAVRDNLARLIARDAAAGRRDSDWLDEFRLLDGIVTRHGDRIRAKWRTVAAKETADV